MNRKSEFLKKMGWSDDLIKHYLVEENTDSPVSSSHEEKIEVFETNSIACYSGASYSNKCQIYK